MPTASELRIEPSPAMLEAARRWLTPVREALGPDFLAAYLTGSVLTQAFDPRRSHINVLVVARSLASDRLTRLGAAIPPPRGRPHFEPLFLTRQQIEKSLDVFPIEWLDLQERHLRLDGEDVLGTLEVPRTYLRLQCEHELRGKHIRLRQAVLAHYARPADLERALAAAASGFATLFRTLLRLRGETPPAETGHVVERVADVYQLDAEALLGAHLARYSGRSKKEQVLPRALKFVAELDRLIGAIDELRVP
jgi:hypothetical protein